MKYYILDHIIDESKEVKVAIIPPLQHRDTKIVKNGVTSNDHNKYLPKTVLSWKDKLKLSKQILLSSTYESAIDISSSDDKLSNDGYKIYDHLYNMKHILKKQFKSILKIDYVIFTF